MVITVPAMYWRSLLAILTHSAQYCVPYRNQSFVLAKQINGFYMKSNTGLKCIKWKFTDTYEKVIGIFPNSYAGEHLSKSSYSVQAINIGLT